MNRVYGWDERDAKLWGALQSLPHYGLIANQRDNPMLSRKDVEKLLEQQAKERGDEKARGR